MGSRLDVEESRQRAVTPPWPSLAWDDEAGLRSLKDAVANAVAQPLATAPRPCHPAVYLLGYDGDSAAYRPAVGGGILYVGSLTSRVLGRLSDHRGSLRAARNLHLDDFWVTVVELSSAPSAQYAEALITDALRPVWNVVLRGLGLKCPGRARRIGHRVSEWDSVHPGRSHQSTNRPRDVEELLGRVQRHFDLHDPLYWRLQLPRVREASSTRGQPLSPRPVPPAEAA